MAEATRRTFLTRTIPLAGAATMASPSVWPAATHDSPRRQLLAAVAAGDLVVVRELLDGEPGLVHTRDDRGRSAFAVALLARQPTAAALLREYGYELDVHEAALALDWETFAVMAEEAPGAINRDHTIGGTAMYAAAIGGAGSQIWRVYSPGGDPNLRPAGESAWTPVRAALEHPDLATAEQTAANLLANGAAIDASQPNGSSVLHAAAARGSLALVEILIRKGADVASRDEDGHTPTDLADAAGHAAVVEMLRRHAEIPHDHSTSRLAYDVEGRPYQAPDLDAFSSLARGRLVGASHGNFDAVRAAVGQHPLLAHAVATTTEMAVEAAAHTGRKPIVEYLLERGAPYSLPTAVMRGDTPRVKALLTEDPLRIHERGAHDFALLWYPAIGGGLVEMMELLLAAGADIERQHSLGTTALHWAAMSGQLDLVELLLIQGTDPNRVGYKFDPAGQTPLAVAEARGHDQVAKLLRDRGARG